MIAKCVAWRKVRKGKGKTKGVGGGGGIGSGAWLCLLQADSIQLRTPSDAQTTSPSLLDTPPRSATHE